MKENIIQNKSYAFALWIVHLYRWLCTEKKEFVLSKQLLRSGTSIGANEEEALGGQSAKDFHAKLNIAYKESRETRYWLRLLHDANLMNHNEYESIITDCEELMKLLSSITKTMKTKISNRNY